MPYFPDLSGSGPLAEAAFDFGVDVQRLLAAADPALVVGDHQLPDLGPDPDAPPSSPAGPSSRSSPSSPATSAASTSAQGPTRARGRSRTGRRCRVRRGRGGGRRSLRPSAGPRPPARRGRAPGPSVPPCRAPPCRSRRCPCRAARGPFPIAKRRRRRSGRSPRADDEQEGENSEEPIRADMKPD